MTDLAALPTFKLSSIAPLRGAKRWAFLERQKTIRVASANGDGPIYVNPLWYVVKDRTIYIPVDQASKHRDNLEAGGRLSAVVDAGDEFGTAHGLMMEGGLERVDDADLLEELHEMSLDKYFYVGHPYRQQYIDFGHCYGRTWWRLRIDSTISWDIRECSPMATRERRTLPPGYTG
jgi:general stress protein 26